MYVYVNLYFNGRHDTCTLCANEICRNSRAPARKGGLQSLLHVVLAERRSRSLRSARNKIFALQDLLVQCSGIKILPARVASSSLAPAGRTSGFAPLTNLACFSLSASSSGQAWSVLYHCGPRRCRTYVPGTNDGSNISRIHRVMLLENATRERESKGANM